MSSPNTIEMEVKILDKSYKLRCDAGDAESLQRSAARLDKDMREMKNSVEGEAVSSERIAVAVAINFAETIRHQEEQLKEVEQRSVGMIDRLVAFEKEIGV